MTIKLRFGWFLIAALCCVSCKAKQPPQPKKIITVSELPAIHVRAEGKFLLTYYDPEQKTFSTVGKLDEVPAPRRHWVRVVDLSVKPGQRKDIDLVYVADLTKPMKNGEFSYMTMSRNAFEVCALQGTNNITSAATAKSPTPGQNAKVGVIVYGTSWCGACRQAREYFKSRNIAFADKDIEADGKAAEELMQKAQAAGVSFSGVPVIDVGGVLVQGFDQDRIESLLK